MDAPLMGEHNAEILRDYLGYDATRVRQLEENGVLHHGER
jgi:crotonobetainyl-CoA:carnitine CoA-transferase CaiB-like acyl-CoA transferase